MISLVNQATLIIPVYFIDISNSKKLIHLMNQTELQHGCWDTAHSSFTRDLSWLCPKKYGTPKYSVWSKKCHSLVGCTSRCLRLYLINWYKLVGFTPFLLVERLNLPFSNTARDGVSMLRSTVRNDGAIAVAWHDQMGCDLAVLEPWNTLLSYFILLLYVFLLLIMIDSWRMPPKMHSPTAHYPHYPHYPHGPGLRSCAEKLLVAPGGTPLQIAHVAVQ